MISNKNGTKIIKCFNVKMLKCYNRKDALSLLELIVVLFIIGLIGTIGLANYRSGQRMNDLTAETQKIASIFKQAQSMALTGYIPPGETERTDCGYGIHLASNTKYQLYVYKNKEGDPPQCTYLYSQGDTLVQEFTLGNDITLSGDCTDLLFQPPAGVIYCDSTQLSVGVEKVFIVTQTALNRTLQIKVGSGGQIGVSY